MTDQGALERARLIDDVRDWHRIANKKNEGMSVGFDTISALLAEIDAAASEARAAQWRPIETAPKDARIIVSTDEGAVGEARYHEDRDGWWWAGTDPTDAHDGQVRYPTHWQPLPEPAGALATPAQPASMEIDWLRRLLLWCRPRLRLADYRAQLDKYLAAGPVPPPTDEPAVVHSASAQSET